MAKHLSGKKKVMTNQPTPPPKPNEKASGFEEAMAHEGVPRPVALVLSKEDLLRSLVKVDNDKRSSNRALAMETNFRTRITSHLESLPTSNAKFAKFNTSPFVLMF